MLSAISLKLKSAGILLLATMVMTTPVCAQTQVIAQRRLSDPIAYKKYIDPLLDVNDFGIEYYDDGAADASVLLPNNIQRPVEAVATLVRLKTKAFPLLIDCLGDTRLTNAIFDGNTITTRMREPVGYLCLDILMHLSPGKPAWILECVDDGLGACMEPEYYFRPDDYYNCRRQNCQARPWVFLVQRKWKRAYRIHLVKFKPLHAVYSVDEFIEPKAEPKK
jgi:hypothetical protein